MSFLQDYRLFNSGNEAHPTYHIFCGLLALSSTISRRVWLPMSYFDVYPNLYIVLVGPPGNRKTSAMDKARDLLDELGTIPMSAECVSKEKLIMDMVDEERVIEGLPESYGEKRIYSPLTVCVAELSEFLQISAAGMIGLLTDIYDRKKYEHKTKNKGVAIISGPFLNVLACTTPEWITTYLRSDIISGGFSRRTLFVFETEKARRIPFPEKTPEMAAAWVRCVDHLRRLGNVKGEFSWTREAKEWYHTWYIELGDKMPKDENTVGYYETKHIQMLKIAMLVALSEGTSLVLDLHHIQAALDLLGLVEANLSRVFQGMGRNEFASATTKIIDCLRTARPVTYKTPDGADKVSPLMSLKQLRAEMWKHVNDQDFDKIIEHLVQTDRVFRVESVDGAIVRRFVGLKSAN
jgi:hypothetical protein